MARSSLENKIFDLIIAVFLGIFLPRLASLISNQFFAFASTPWDYLHHFLQMAFAFIIMLLWIRRKPLKEWGFNLNEARWSLRTFGIFSVGYAIFLPLGTFITQWLSGWPPLIDYPPSWNNFLDNLLFSSTMPGISEEILFRALVMGILSRSWQGKIKATNFEISHPNIIAAIIFAGAHVGFTLLPFQITYLNVMQIIFALVLGILYGVVLDKSKSLLGPILLHNASDGISVTTYFLFTVLFMK